MIRVLDGGRHTSLHLRDYTSRAQFERTEFFNVLAKVNRLNDQIMTVVWHRGRLVNLGINRDRVFSAEERTMLQWLQPHLAVALERVGVGGNEAWPEGYGQQWVALSKSFHPVDLTKAQAAVLKTYFPGWRREREPWPPHLSTWLAAATRTAPGRVIGEKFRALRAESVRGELVIRYYPATAERDAALRLIEWARPPSFLLLRSAGLTTRECEVLHWMAQGKRDAEIALVLACAPATVGKHVENLLRKLHAETRGAAVSAARGMLSR